jgi:hypothetical protein
MPEKQGELVAVVGEVGLVEDLQAAGGGEGDHGVGQALEVGQGGGTGGCGTRVRLENPTADQRRREACIAHRR